MRVLALLVLLAVPAHAEIVREMTPELVREALAIGAAAKNYPIYRLKGLKEDRPVAFDTPFMRVAVLIYKAKKEYRTVDESAVTPALIEPFVGIYAPAHMVQPTRYEKPRLIGVKQIVLTGPGGTNPVHPSEATPIMEAYSNALGGQWEANRLNVRFPIEAIRHNDEVHVIWDDGKDITYRLDLSKVR